MSSPSTVHMLECLIVLSVSLMSIFFVRPMFITVDLSLLVLLYHSCSKSWSLSTVFIARAVCSAADFDLYGLICVKSSAYAIYSVLP